MTPEDAMIELLSMVGAAKGSAVQLSSADLSSWPTSAVAAMKSQQVLKKARPASTAVCPGCEESCTMPVNTLPGGTRKTSWFVVCDKRDDINRVPISADNLQQWRCGPEAICSFVARALGIRRSGQPDSDSGFRAIGVATGSRRSQMLSLALKDDPMLVAGEGSLPLAEILRFGANGYSLDDRLIQQLVDQSNMADPRYTPSNARREIRKQEIAAMHASWRRAYRKLTKDHPGKSDVWCSHRIQKMGIAKGRSAETIRRRMKG